MRGGVCAVENRKIYSLYSDPHRDEWPLLSACLPVPTSNRTIPERHRVLIEDFSVWIDIAEVRAGV